MPEKDDNENKVDTSHASTTDPSRRDFLKGSVTAAGAGLAAAATSGLSAAEAAESQPENPYGGRPGGGISLPEY